MEIEKEAKKDSLPLKNSPSERYLNRAKTPLRISYETEVEIIRKKIGSIDDIREGLGLSRRKMCQLLLVDPSAWTRWGRNSAQIPPHIYRSLQWYLALIEKQPEWHPKNTYLGAFGETQYQMKKIEQKWEEKLEQFNHLKINGDLDKSLVETQVSSINEKNRLLDQRLIAISQSQIGWKILLIANTAILLVILFWLTFYQS